MPPGRDERLYDARTSALVECGAAPMALATTNRKLPVKGAVALGKKNCKKFG